MRVLDKTLLTEDEQYDPAERVAEVIKNLLQSINMDTYNKVYVVRVTVDKVDEVPSSDGDDD